MLATERARPSLAYRAGVQMIFQDPFASLNPVHTVGHHLERPLRRHRHGPARAELTRAVHTLLETVGLHPPAEMAGKYPHQLSGGQRQRVGIARALAVRARAGAGRRADQHAGRVDPHGDPEPAATLKQRQGLAYLYITHDLGSARAIADRLLVM